MREKSIQGFQTGDMVVATVTKGKKIGTYKGRVAVRRSGSFNIQCAQGVIQGISHKYCRLIQRRDGYGYVLNKADKTGCEQVTTAKASTVALSALYLPGLNAEVSRAN